MLFLSQNRVGFTSQLITTILWLVFCYQNLQALNMINSIVATSSVFSIKYRDILIGFLTIFSCHVFGLVYFENWSGISFSTKLVSSKQNQFPRSSIVQLVFHGFFFDYYKRITVYIEKYIPQCNIFNFLIYFEKVGRTCEQLNPCRSGILCRDTCVYPFFECVECDKYHYGLHCDRRKGKNNLCYLLS